ncbi:MAG: glycosyltransferase [Acidimicrobiales bacterium]
MSGRIAVVPPRFGAGVVGGAEAVCREAALGLAERGWEVEILTTCAVDHYTWANDLPEGSREEEGLLVRRWPMVHDGAAAGLRALQKIQDGLVPTLDEQIGWQSLHFRVPGLFHHLLREGSKYQAVVFAPYLFWTSTVCLPLVAERAVALPCLHDEVYARLAVVRHVLSDPAAVWFLSEPEHELAHRLGPVAERHSVVGAGVHVPASYHPDAFRRRHRIDRPFILYAGRREAGKGWQWLLETFAEMVALGGVEVDLVSAGVGEVTVPGPLCGRVVDLGFLSDSDLRDAFAAALAYVQPSRMESFSRTIMESWLAGTPVLAVEASEVVAWHCRRSGAGITFDGAAGLATALRRLVSDPAEAATLGARGRRYVLDNCSWPVVLDRVEEELDALDARWDPSPVEPEPAGRPVLVVGSYPPVPGLASEATLEAARRAHHVGDAVVVASPRAGAAHNAVRLRGPLAGARLDALRRRTGAQRLVLCAEAGMPVPLRARRTMLGRAVEPVLEALTVLSLTRALDRFAHVSAVVTGDLGVGVDLPRVLREHAEEVVVNLPPGPVLPAGVTVFGGPDVLVRGRPRRVVSFLARMLLGRHAPAVLGAARSVMYRIGGAANPTGLPSRRPDR